MSETVQSKGKKFTIYDMVVVGVMAAVVFVGTAFIKIDIPTPAGPVMLKLANAFVLLAGMLFGGLRGGLAAGIGSALYDVITPAYITDAPLTLIRFFLMAAICGWICCAARRKGPRVLWNVIGTSAGALFSLAFYFVQSLIKQLIQLQPLDVAVVNILPKMGTSAINTVIAVVVACLIAPLCAAGLHRAGFYQRLHIHTAE